MPSIDRKLELKARHWWLRPSHGRLCMPPTVTETIRLHRLRWFGHVQRIEGNRIPKRVLYMNLETTRLRGRPWYRWQDEVREDGRIVGGKGWKERVYNKEERKKLLRTARNRRILHMPMEWMWRNEYWASNLIESFLVMNCCLPVHMLLLYRVYLKLWTSYSHGHPCSLWANCNYFCESHRLMKSYLSKTQL
jgi:hypothetical protein